MSTNGKPSTRASSSRAASQSATREQPNVPQLPDAIDPQDNAPVTMAMFLQQLSTQVQSVMQAFNSVREETAELRRLVLSPDTPGITSPCCPRRSLRPFLQARSFQRQ
ncbi:hypothetical protein E4U51_005201 [Claviceps purpurea]|nr:hypothetical protein E4U51_005201 [Claviceps purpurea]